MPQEDTNLCNLDLSSDDSEELCDDISDSTFDTIEENALSYIHGYVCRRYLRRHKCDICIVETFLLIQMDSLLHQTIYFYLSKQKPGLQTLCLVD